MEVGPVTGHVLREADGGWELEVNGVRHAGPVLERTGHEVMGMFTADAEVVSAWLPSPRLHPLRQTRNRSQVDIYGAEWGLSVGDSPQVRYLEMGVEAWVTYGARPAPPVLPTLEAFGILSRPRWNAGASGLLTVVTDPGIAELYQAVLGFPAVPGDITRTSGTRGERWTTCLDGQPVLGLQVRTDGKPKPLTSDIVDYTMDGQVLHRLTSHMTAQSQMHFAGRSARMKWGLHPQGQRLRALRLSTRPLFVGVDDPAHFRTAPPVELDPATSPPAHAETPGT